jgi:hypothetical protein
MVNKLALYIGGIVCVLLGIAVPAKAQFWNKKDYHKWSANDCRKILSDSPWTKNQSFSSVQMLSGSQNTSAAAGSAVTSAEDPENPQGTSNGQFSAPGRQPVMDISYTAQIFSALPVREAQVRLDQIAMHYDRMTAAQKQAFDESAARFLAVQFPKTIVIRVNYSTNVGYWQAALESQWQLENTAKLRSSTYLAVGGTTVPLLNYRFAPVKEHAFFLVFPRTVNGEPLLNASRKSLTLQITSAQLQFSNSFDSSGSLTAQPPDVKNIVITFNVKKMAYHGKLAY